MKRKNCIIMLCMAFVMSDNVMSYAQHGVLLQKNHSGHVRLDDNGIPGKNGVLKTEKRITVNLTGDEIQPRRGDAITVADMGYIVDSTNVNNEFGAGESAFIRENRIQRPRNKPGAGYDSLFNNPWNNPMPLNPTLQLGSEYSANIVINTYNADAYASGAVRLSIGGIVDEQYKDVNTSLIDSAHIRNYTKMITPGDIYDLWSYGGCSNINWGKSKSYPEGEEYGSDRIGCMVVSGISSTKLTPNPVISYGNLSAGAADGIYAVGAVIADELAPSGSSQAHIVDIYLANHFYTTDNHNNDAGHWRTVATSGVVPYTSTANSDRDNGVDLLQKAGQPAINTSASIGNAPNKTNGALIPYRRPTTVAIDGDNRFEAIAVKDINWWYNYHDLNRPYGGNWYSLSAVSGNIKNEIASNCGCHNSITYQTTSISGEWDSNIEKGGIVAGDTYLDAAVQIIGGSVVCVINDIEDATRIPSHASSRTGTDTSSTAAVLVLPAEDRFTLRTAGSVINMNMAHDDSVAGGVMQRENKYYLADAFPAPETGIYMTPSFGTLGSEYGAANPLSGYGFTDRFSINAPHTFTKAAIFGVGADFVHNNALTAPELRTGGVANTLPSVINPVTLENNPGVIEVGTSTLGQEHFHIYSGGVLKNFESECADPADNFSINFGVYGASNAPGFTMDGDSAISILNFGNNGAMTPYLADINFAEGGITALNNAFDGSQTGKGALHIQARGDVRFMAGAPADLDASGRSNELRIISDDASILIKSAFTFNETDSNLIILANGANTDSPTRSCIADTGNLRTGMVYFGNDVNLTFDGKGFTFIRSPYDDVFFEGDLNYTNATADPLFGEVIIQAGQDIYGTNKSGGKTISFTQAGEKDILLEAKKTIHTKQDIIYERAGASKGNIILKAGYDSFLDSANISTNVAADGGWDKKGDCAPHSYSAREACMSDTGGDIWFEGNATVNLDGTNDIQTVLRAYNSIYMDSSFVYSQQTGVGAKALLYAELGNIEAIVDSAEAAVSFNIAGTADSSELRLQAGNLIWDEGNINDAPVNFPDCYVTGSASGAEYDGNILFNKPLDIVNRGLGYTLISAGRDIESQVHAPFVFTYDNPKASDFYLTAGRHIESHALIQFNHKGTNADIIMEAGRLDAATQTPTNALCKTTESGTSLTESGSTPKPIDGTNGFAAGGAGQGSILLFDSVEFNCDGTGNILMTALNGNIESDPYLHRSDSRAVNSGIDDGYNSSANIHNAPLIINHSGEGVTRLEAIDIKLHDATVYNGSAANLLKNGQFQIAAFDSILTRNIKYVNATDTGSVFVTTGKYKANTNCDDVLHPYNCEDGGPGIHHGHIVLGYGADCDYTDNYSDSIVFDYNSNGTNANTTGGNVHILAGFEGYEKNRITGLPNTSALFPDGRDAGKAYGGNITFDYMEIYMPRGSGRTGGFTEIRTPNGNIWGKDSLKYRGIDGDLLIDAGLGSDDDEKWSVLWALSGATCPRQNILNTFVPTNCDDNSGSWRTGNIIMKGGSLNFGNPTASAAGVGNAIFRTREGFIDTYDAFTADSMSGDILKYAGVENNPDLAKRNNYGDVSERDFSFRTVREGGSVFFGADDNIMLNYGTSSGSYLRYGENADNKMGFPGEYASGDAVKPGNPYYATSYKQLSDVCYSTYDVQKDGYLYYRSPGYAAPRKYHRLYAGCDMPVGARDLVADFDTDGSNPINTGGFAAVASNYIDIFTNFRYCGGTGAGLGEVPGTGALHGEDVAGYGLFIKSQFDGKGENAPEHRRASCEDCGASNSFPIGDAHSEAISEMTYIGFHGDARIRTHAQHSYLEAPVIEVFGHAELNTHDKKAASTKITLKADSLIFHDSLIIDGTQIELVPLTTGEQRANDMRYGVINDRGANTANYSRFGPAITMEDRNIPVLELGYQRCAEPSAGVHDAPNAVDNPKVGGDVVVAFKHGYRLPMFNTVVANHARISFVTDSFDRVQGGEYIDAFIRTDLLRIRNRVEFYTDLSDPVNRSGKFVMSTLAQMDEHLYDPGMYTRHLHTEPGSELSIPGEDSLVVVNSTVVGGYGTIHENVSVKSDGILAPGLASLMESDCLTPARQGKLLVHNLRMEKDAVLRISVSSGYAGGTAQSDTLEVADRIFFYDKIQLQILPEAEYLDQGCYLFLVYGDSLGASSEYVKNLVLAQQRYGDNYYALDFSEPGKVYLCVTKIPYPEIRRSVDLPSVEGVTTDPIAGRYYVRGHRNFSFTAQFTGTPLKVWALGYYSSGQLNLDETSESLGGNLFRYEIVQVVEPWTVYIGPEEIETGNGNIAGNRIWTYRNTLYINASKNDNLSIYGITGALYKRVDIREGMNTFTLERGIYTVTLKDGEVYKIVIK